MKLAPPGIPTSSKGGSRIVARVETLAKGANVDAVVTNSGVCRRDGRVASLGGVIPVVGSLNPGANAKCRGAPKCPLSGVDRK
jgi:hypothetical protein